MAANLENFEFAALQQADNYRVALLAEFAPHLRGHVLEVGSGIGQLTEVLQQKSEIFAPIGMSLLAIASATGSTPHP